MILKDWINDAASAVKHELLSFMHQDPTLAALVPLMDQNVHIKRIATIIAKNCPVPRCDACKHWTFRQEYVEPHGVCDADAIGSDCNDYTIIVPADFGCVQWETK